MPLDPMLCSTSPVLIRVLHVLQVANLLWAWNGTLALHNLEFKQMSRERRNPHVHPVVRDFFFYLLELSDAGVAAESLLLPVHQQEVVGRRSARQVIAALLTAVHDQAVGPAVHVKARVTADLVGHSLKADLVPDLSTEQEKKKNLNKGCGSG